MIPPIPIAIIWIGVTERFNTLFVWVSLSKTFSCLREISCLRKFEKHDNIRLWNIFLEFCNLLLVKREMDEDRYSCDNQIIALTQVMSLCDNFYYSYIYNLIMWSATCKRVGGKNEVEKKGKWRQKKLMKHVMHDFMYFGNYQHTKIETKYLCESDNLNCHVLSFIWFRLMWYERCLFV